MPYKMREDKQAHERKYWKERRERAIEMKGGKCVKCESELFLNFDHKDPSTKKSHIKWNWSWERILVELEKCQLLCETCNIVKAKKNNEKRWRTRKVIFVNSVGYLPGAETANDLRDVRGADRTIAV